METGAWLKEASRHGRQIHTFEDADVLPAAVVPWKPLATATGQNMIAATRRVALLLFVLHLGGHSSPGLTAPALSWHGPQNQGHVQAAAQRRQVGTDEEPRIPCQDYWKAVLKNPLKIFHVRCYTIEELDEELIQGKATLDDILAILRGDDIDSIQLHVSALEGYWDRPEFMALLRDLWLDRSESYPELSWDLIRQPSTRAMLARVLAIGDPGHFSEYYEYLLRNYRHEDKRVRSAVAGALGSLGGNDVVPLLEEMARVDDFFVARNAMGSLRRIGTVEARAALEHLIEDPTISERKQATARSQLANFQPAESAMAFPSCPVPRQNPSVRQGLERPVRTERIRARQASYDELSLVFAGDRMVDIVNGLNAMVVYTGDSRVLQLWQDLWDEKRSAHPDFSWDCLSHPMVRVSLATLLAEADRAEAAAYRAYLRSAMAHQNHYVRAAAVFALGEVGSDRDVSSLEEVVLTEDLDLALRTVDALARMDSDQARDALKRLRDDPRLAPETKAAIRRALPR